MGADEGSVRPQPPVFVSLIYPMGNISDAHHISYIWLQCFTAVITAITPGPSPYFTLHDVKIYAFNLSTATSTLTSNLQITIFCKNYLDTPIHIDKVDFYISYKNQQITPPTTIPPMYLGHNDVTTWSPYLNGTAVPVGPDLTTFLAQDLTAGGVLIDVKVTGRLRYKDFSVTQRYRVEVSCGAYVAFGVNESDGNVVGSLVKDTFVEGCRTHAKL